MSNITFGVIPTSTLRVPGVDVEIQTSQANSGQVPQRTLILGQMTAAGTFAANTPVLATSLSAIQAGAGINSMLAQMYYRYRLSDSFGEVWVLPVADAGGGVQATGTLVITGPATASGTLALYVAGRLIAVPVNSGDSATVIGVSVLAAMALLPTLAVTATASTGTVTFTAVHKGLSGNDIDLRVNYRGAVNGEVLPAGVSVSFTGTAAGTGTLLAGGATNPTLTSALANVHGDQTFDFIVFPWTDATSLNAIQSFLSDTAGRWSWSQQLYGGAWAAYRGALGALASFGTGRNDPHISIMGFFDSPTPSWEWAADYCAAAAPSLRANPARPLNTLALTVAAPPLPSRFTTGERNTLLFDGVSTHRVDDSNTVRIERSITTYQLNASGQPDTTFLNTEGLYVTQFCARDMITRLSSLYSRSILVADGTPIGGGTVACTSQTILATAIGFYQSYCDAALMQNPDVFMKNAQAQNAGGGLVKLLLPMQRSAQLEIIAVAIQLLQS